MSQHLPHKKLIVTASGDVDAELLAVDDHLAACETCSDCSRSGATTSVLTAPKLDWARIQLANPKLSLTKGALHVAARSQALTVRSWKASGDVRTLPTEYSTCWLSKRHWQTKQQSREAVLTKPQPAASRSDSLEAVPALALAPHLPASGSSHGPGGLLFSCIIAAAAAT